MKSSKIVSLIVVLCLVMTCVAVVGVPVVSAIGPATNTSSLYQDGFENYSGNQGYQATLQGLKNYGWYAADQTQLYTNVAAVAPYSTVNYTLAEIATVDSTHCLHITSAVNKNTSNTISTLGYGKTFPGVAAGGAATGSWEITFDFKPVLNASNKTQFAFTLNTADGSAADDTAAEHNIIAGYGTNFYLGYRDFNTIYSSNITQGTLPAVKIGGVKWYQVKTYLNCDARYYSVELYDKSTGKLIARRSPISFAGTETIGFLKFSALGLSNEQHNVYVDNVSIEQKATADTTIYNETFDSFTNASYRAATAMSSETTGSSYFEGYTPWRGHTSVGNKFDLVANDDTLNSQVVKLGNGAASGLVYVQANENLLTSSTQTSRGLLKISYKFKPLTIGGDFMLITSPDLAKLNNSSYAALTVTNNDGRIMLRNNQLNPSRWYKVEQYFDVTTPRLTTVVTDMVGNESILYTGSAPSAVKGIMFKVPSDSTVLMDDIKLEYCSEAPTEAPTPVPTAVPTAEPTAVPTEEPTEAPLTAPTVSMTAKSAANSENAFYYMITVTLNDGTADAFVVKHFPDDRDEAIARLQNFNVSNISGVTANLISVLKDIPLAQADREIKTKVTLNYTLGGASGSADAENITSLNATKE